MVFFAGAGNLLMVLIFHPNQRRGSLVITIKNHPHPSCQPPISVSKYYSHWSQTILKGQKSHQKPGLGAKSL